MKGQKKRTEPVANFPPASYVVLVFFIYICNICIQNRSRTAEILNLFYTMSTGFPLTDVCVGRALLVCFYHLFFLARSSSEVLPFVDTKWLGS